MNTVIDVPREFLKTLSEFRFPVQADQLLQHLMDLNNDGLLSPTQRDELLGLVELSESISLFRAQALKLLASDTSER